jgi:hypothetical protein
MRGVYRYLFRAIALEVPAVILLVFLLSVL